MPRNEKRLDAFTTAYVEAALWSSTDNADDSGGEPLDKNYSASDIAPATLEAMRRDCADFQEKYGDLLSEIQLSDDRAGHDFWLSRNGHGAGFFDLDVDEEFEHVRDALQDAAETYGNFDLYVGDDGVIYGYGHEEALNEHRTTVRDFNTRDELVDHAKGEGATHVVVVGSGATLYFPTQGGKYEEARAWRQNGYWHAPAPGARKVVDSLPRDAQPIGGARRAAEATSTRHKHYEVTADGDVIYSGDSLREAQDKFDYAAHKNYEGAGYVDAVIEIRADGRVLRSFGPSDHRPHYFHPNPRWIDKGVTGTGRARESRQQVRDYVAVDTRGRQVFGPTKDYGEAKRQADRAGGVVKFTSDRPLAMEEAFGRRTQWTDWQILDAIDRGHMVPPEAERRAAKLAQLGFIDTTGTWRLTAKGRRVVDQKVPVAAEAKRSGRTRKATETAMQIAEKLAKKVDGSKPKPIPGGFRWSEKNESAQFWTDSPEYHQKIVVVVSVFEDGSASLNFFSDENLSDGYENISNFTYGPGGFTSHQVDVGHMVADIEWVRKTVDGYAASWQPADDAEMSEARPRPKRSAHRPRRRSSRRAKR